MKKLELKYHYVYKTTECVPIQYRLHKIFLMSSDLRVWVGNLTRVGFFAFDVVSLALAHMF